MVIVSRLGDAVFIDVAAEGDRSLEVRNVGEKNSEFLLFEME